MSNEEKSFNYDEGAAVEFILNRLPETLKAKIDEDAVYYFLDLLCEFYERNDYLDEDDEEKEERELVKFIIEQAKEDEIGAFTPDEVRIFLAAESDYTDTLDIFD
ncbi:MAG: hypothetical protein LBR64_07115 [Dysgonamonadaceae bacterium]|jgi:hypothetical protein|nr:hypothetical protein [Dysgonamonadaceae bacterium]